MFKPSELDGKFIRNVSLFELPLWSKDEVRGFVKTQNFPNNAKTALKDFNGVALSKWTKEEMIATGICETEAATLVVWIKDVVEKTELESMTV